MADHARKTIRTAVKDLLVGKTDAEDRVFTSREVPWQTTEFPGIAVYALEESSEAALGSTEPKVLERTLQLAVLVVQSLTEGIDDELDRLALQVETAMHAAPTFGVAAVIDSVLTSTAIEIAEEGRRAVGVMRLTYAVRYQSE